MFDKYLFYEIYDGSVKMIDEINIVAIKKIENSIIIMLIMLIIRK